MQAERGQKSQGGNQPGVEGGFFEGFRDHGAGDHRQNRPGRQGVDKRQGGGCCPVEQEVPGQGGDTGYDGDPTPGT